MIKHYGNGLFEIGNLGIQFSNYRLLDFSVGFYIGKYIPLSLRLGWFEVSFHMSDGEWEYDFCDEDCCN